MSILDRIGRLTARRPVALIVAAALLAAFAALGGSGVERELTNMNPVDETSDSARADQILERQFQGGSANYIVTVTAGPSIDQPAVARAATRLVGELDQDFSVESVSSYWTSGRPSSLRSRDGRLGLILVRLAGDNQSSADAAFRLSGQLGQESHGLQLGFAGAAQVEAEASSRSEADLQRAELFALPITLLLLVLVFGSAIAAALPLVVGMMSILSTMLVLRVIASFTDVSIFALNITTALGLGLAIDYSLFIVSRFKEELAGGRDKTDALTITMRTAGRTVAFSALTVAVALSALLVFPMEFLRSFGYAGIAVVLLSSAFALVALPAMLTLLGHRVNSLDVLARWRRGRSPGRFWHRLATLVMRRPVVFGLAAVALLMLLGSPFANASFGTSDERVLPRGAQAQVATEPLRDDFDSAWTVPVVLPGVGAEQVPDRLPGYAARLSTVPGVVSVDTAVGTYADGRGAAPTQAATNRFSDETDSWLEVATAAQPMSARGQQLVRDLRAVPGPGTPMVTGQAAQFIDAKASIQRHLVPAALVLVSSILVLLFLFTGSLVLPLKAVALGALSLSATFGAMVYVFQEGHLAGLVGNPIITGSIDLTTPILMFVMAFGLSMDYEVFLLSRIREIYQQSGDNQYAVATGLQLTGKLVTSAAALLAVLLLALATSGITPLKLLGVGLALAIIMDATLVRGVLVPSFMRLMGSLNWWAPTPLRRLHQRIGLAENDGPGASPGDGRVGELAPRSSLRNGASRSPSPSLRRPGRPGA